MTPEELHRAVIRAVAFGDQEGERRLRLRFRELDHDSAIDYLHATTVACLVHRFGEVAPLDRVGEAAPLDRVGFGRTGLDRVELGRFMAELRAAASTLHRSLRPSPCPPRNLLEVEAVIRGVYGEPHMLEEVGPKQQREGLAFVLRYLTDSVPEIRRGFDEVIDRSQELQRHWLIGDPAETAEGPGRRSP